MNKKLLAAAVASALAIPGIALAQSSVTLYGTIDTGIRNQSKIVTGPGTDGTLTSVTDGLNTTNRWGMTGSEDLGGGLKANFKLEGQYSSDTGAGPAGGATFARTSKVGLSSGGNSFDLGRDYTVNFKEFGIYDPMSYNYTGITPNVQFTAGVRSSNMITAATSFNGVNLRAEYALGEVVGSSSSGSRFGIGGDFGVGGVKVAGAYSTTKDATNTGSVKDSTIGASYDMNEFVFKAGWAQTDWDATYAGATLDKARMLALGAGYHFSSRLLGRIGYYDVKATGLTAAGDGKRKNTIVGIDYSLSNRTTVYAEIDHNGLNGSLIGTKVDGSAVNDGSSGVGVGIAHKF
ncbi:MAG: porin [Burkholderiales bacterium]